MAIRSDDPHTSDGLTPLSYGSGGGSGWRFIIGTTGRISPIYVSRDPFTGQPTSSGGGGGGNVGLDPVGVSPGAAAPPGAAPQGNQLLPNSATLPATTQPASGSSSDNNAALIVLAVLAGLWLIS